MYKQTASTGPERRIMLRLYRANSQLFLSFLVSDSNEQNYQRYLGKIDQQSISPSNADRRGN